MITDGTALAVSDGSFKAGFGTYSWIITTQDERYCLEGVGVVPGEKEFQSAYRSELCGLHAIMTVLQELARRSGLQEGIPMIEVGCDGEAAVKQVSKTWKDLGLDEKQADLV